MIETIPAAMNSTISPTNYRRNLQPITTLNDPTVQSSQYLQKIQDSKQTIRKIFFRCLTVLYKEHYVPQTSRKINLPQLTTINVVEGGQSMSKV